MENFPANTNGDREKRVTRIAQGKVLRKRRTIGRRFADTIVGEKSSASPKATPSSTTIDKFKTQTAADNPCAPK